jgi:hypothetical protein
MSSLNRLNQDFFVGAALAILSVSLLVMTLDFNPGTTAYPRIVLGTLLLMSIAICIKSVINTENNDERTPDESILSIKIVKYPFIVFGVIVIYVLSIMYIGFFVSTGLMTIFMLYFMKIRKVRTYIFTVVGIILFVHLLFGVQLNVNLPSGILI